MELEYRKISEERCKEIDSWEIRDPYGYGKIFTAEREDFVTNADESILFCHAFMPRHDDSDKYEYFLFIRNDEYYLMVYDFASMTDDETGPTLIRNEDIVILENEFIEKSENKKELLGILKAVISKYEENCCRLPVARTWKYTFRFTYKGEKI